MSDTPDLPKIRQKIDPYPLYKVILLLYSTRYKIQHNNIYIVGLLYLPNMEVIKGKKVKIVTLNYFETKQNDIIKRQYRVSIAPKMIESLEMKAKDKLKVWVNKEKKQIRIKKS